MFHQNRDDKPDPIEINLNVTVQGLNVSGVGELKQLIQNLTALLNTAKDEIMASIDDLAKDVSDESTLIDSVSTLLSGIKQQLADALAGTTLPAGVQAKVDAVFAQAESNKSKLTDAIAANTPAADVPTDQPPTP